MSRPRRKKNRKIKKKKRSRLRLSIYSQNVNSLSCSKFQVLSRTLRSKANVICLQELNLNDKNNIITINPDGSDSEYDLIIPNDDTNLTNRIGFMIKKNVPYQIIKTISIRQEQRSRGQKDDRVAFISAVKISNKAGNKHLLVINLYFTPDCSLDNIKKCCEIISTLKYQNNVVIFGDTNINMFKRSPKSIFYDSCRPLKQLVNSATRKAAWFCKKRNKNYESATLIDVCLASAAVSKDAKLMIEDIVLTTFGRKQNMFDHSGILLHTDLFNLPNSITKIIVTNSLKRKKPSPEVITQINNKLDQTPPENIKNFEDILSIITDTIKSKCSIPTPTTKRVIIRNDVHISDQTKKLIAKKRHALNSKKTKDNKIYIRQLTKQIKVGLQNDRLKTIEEANFNWGNLVKNKGVWPVYNTIKSGRCTNSTEFDDSLDLKKFVQEASDFYDNKSRLVGHNDVKSASDQLGNAVKFPERILDESEGEIRFLEIGFDEFDKFFESRILKVVDCNGMTISDHFAPFWTNFVKLYNASLAGKKISSFPKNEPMYFQKLIKKGNIKKIKSTNDIRPIGINSAITKYICCSQFFQQMQEKLKNYLVTSLNNFSFHGTIPLVINLLDKANKLASEGYVVSLVNYDISNAFGQNSREVLLKILKSIGFDSDVVSFVEQFCCNQNQVKTLIKDDSGSVFWSETVEKNHNFVGFPQGAIGSSILYSIFSFILSFGLHEKNLLPIHASQHYFYVDDSSTIVVQKTSSDLVSSIRKLNSHFHLISTFCGLKSNVQKTVVLPVNVPTNEISDCGLPTVTSTKFLGISVSSIKNRLSCHNVERQLISALSSLAPILTVLRDVTTHVNLELKWKTRRMIARNLILSHLYSAPLFLAYTAKDPENYNNVLNKIVVAINQAVRITGLSSNTPSETIWSIIGCSPRDFITGSLLTIGKKMQEINGWQTDRAGKFRNCGHPKTFEYFFKCLWNKLGSDDLRLKFINESDGYGQLKAYLKKNRIIQFDLQNVVDFTKFIGKKSFEVLNRRI